MDYQVGDEVWVCYYNSRWIPGILVSVPNERDKWWRVRTSLHDNGGWDKQRLRPRSSKFGGKDKPTEIIPD